jgi:hypothetical protein
MEAFWRLDVLIFTYAWGTERRDGICEHPDGKLPAGACRWKRRFGSRNATASHDVVFSLSARAVSTP